MESGPCTQSKINKPCPLLRSAGWCLVLGVWCLVLCFGCGTPSTPWLHAPGTWHNTAREREREGPPLHSFLPEPRLALPDNPNPNTTTVVAADTQTSPSQSRSELPALRLGPRCSRLSTASLLCLDPSRQQSRPTFKMREIVSCPRPQKTTTETRRRPMLLSHPLPLSLRLPHHRDHTHSQASKTPSTPWEEHPDAL